MQVLGEQKQTNLERHDVLCIGTVTSAEVAWCAAKVMGTVQTTHAGRREKVRARLSKPCGWAWFYAVGSCLG